LSTCSISLIAECNGSFLIIRISNNFDPDAVPRKGTGTGISNVQKRMAAIYGRNDLLTTTAINEVFEVTLQIPATKK
jgi:LytS/YehU family sensor histidine kinase